MHISFIDLISVSWGALLELMTCIFGEVYAAYFVSQHTKFTYVYVYVN